MGEALACASPSESERLVPELLELAVVPTFADEAQPVRTRWPKLRASVRNQRISDLALAQIARSWRQVIPDHAQAVLAIGENRWSNVLPQLSTDPQGEVRWSLAALIGEAGDTRLSHVLAGMLHDQDERVGEQAERSLLLLAVSVIREELIKTPGVARFVSSVTSPTLARCVHVGIRGGVDALCEHVAEAAMTLGEHNRRGPVVAAVMLASRQNLRRAKQGDAGAKALAAWLGHEQHPSHSVLRSVIRWTKAPVGRLRALELLGRESLAVAAADRLMRAKSMMDHELVLQNAHLLVRPSRVVKLTNFRGTLRKVGPKAKKLAKDDVATFPSPAAIKQLSDEARRALPGFVARVPTPNETRRTAVEPLVWDGDPLVRYAVVRAIPVTGLSESCFDTDVRVARSAFVAGSSAGTGMPVKDADRRVLSVLARSPHAELRGWAAEERAWSTRTTGTVHGRQMSRRAMAADRFGYTDDLRGQMRGSDAVAALTALETVRALGLSHEFEPDIINVAATPVSDDAQRRVVATATAMLGGLGNARAAEVALILVGHPDARVRANAVEALAKLERRGFEAKTKGSLASVIVELKGDQHHRVKANAIRAGIAGGDRYGETEAMAHMLADARPLHRLAGVWLAGRVMPGFGRTRLAQVWPEFVARIGELARHDDDVSVRTRAIACTQRLQADLRSSWKRDPALAVVGGGA